MSDYTSSSMSLRSPLSLTGATFPRIPMYHAKKCHKDSYGGQPEYESLSPIAGSSNQGQLQVSRYQVDALTRGIYKPNIAALSL